MKRAKTREPEDDLRLTPGGEGGFAGPAEGWRVETPDGAVAPVAVEDGGGAPAVALVVQLPTMRLRAWGKTPVEARVKLAYLLATAWRRAALLAPGELTAAETLAVAAGAPESAALAAARPGAVAAVAASLAQWARLAPPDVGAALAVLARRAAGLAPGAEPIKTPRSGGARAVYVRPWAGDVPLPDAAIHDEDDRPLGPVPPWLGAALDAAGVGDGDAFEAAVRRTGARPFGDRRLARADDGSTARADPPAPEPGAIPPLPRLFFSTRAAFSLGWLRGRADGALAALAAFAAAPADLRESALVAVVGRARARADAATESALPSLRLGADAEEASLVAGARGDRPAAERAYLRLPGALGRLFDGGPVRATLALARADGAPLTADDLAGARRSVAVWEASEARRPPALPPPAILAAVARGGGLVPDSPAAAEAERLPTDPDPRPTPPTDDRSDR